MKKGAKDVGQGMGSSWGLVKGMSQRVRGDAKKNIFGRTSGIVHYFKDILQGALRARAR